MIDIATIIRHESGHAAGIHSQGGRVLTVDRIDRGSQNGYVQSDGTGLMEEGTHILCAAIAEGDLPSWPLNPARSVDEARFAQIAGAHQWDEHDYMVTVNRARQLMSTPRFQKAYRAISRALVDRPYLDARALHQLLAKPAVAVQYKATPGTRDAVLADVRRRERELEDEQAWAAVYLVKSLLGAED